MEIVIFRRNIAILLEEVNYTNIREKRGFTVNMHWIEFTWLVPPEINFEIFLLLNQAFDNFCEVYHFIGQMSSVSVVLSKKDYQHSNEKKTNYRNCR